MLTGNQLLSHGRSIATNLTELYSVCVVFVFVCLFVCVVYMFVCICGAVFIFHAMFVVTYFPILPVSFFFLFFFPLSLYLLVCIC